MPADRFIYSHKDIREALVKIGVRPGDTIFAHVSLGRLGFSAEGQDSLSACKTLIRALSDAIGLHGTLLIPGYTYSLGKDEIFDVVRTPSTTGPFSEYVRNLPGWKRSREPMLSVSGTGSTAADLFHDLPPTSFGKNSIYDRLCDINAWIITIGLDLHWATFRHHIEEVSKIPFRRNKIFIGHFKNDDGSILHKPWDYFAAPFIPECAPDGTRLTTLLRERGLVREESVGIGKIIGIPAQIFREASIPLLEKNPWLTARGPACPEEKIVQNMNRDKNQ